MKLASNFSKRVQIIFEFYLKDSHKRARNMKLASNFSKRVQIIFEFYLKDSHKRAKLHTNKQTNSIEAISYGLNFELRR